MEHVGSVSPSTRSSGLSGFSRISKQWKTILIIALFGAAVGLAVSLLQPNRYSATAAGVVVAIGENQDLSGALAGSELARASAISYESLALSKSVAERVGADLSLDRAPDSLIKDIVADSPDGTAEIHITATADSPQLASDIANTWLSSLSRQVEELESLGSADGQPASHVSIQSLGSASSPDAPSSPRTAVNITLGLLVGLALGLSYAYVRSDLSRE